MSKKIDLNKQDNIKIHLIITTILDIIIGIYLILGVFTLVIGFSEDSVVKDLFNYDFIVMVIKFTTYTYPLAILLSVVAVIFDIYKRKQHNKIYSITNFRIQIGLLITSILLLVTFIGFTYYKEQTRVYVLCSNSMGEPENCMRLKNETVLDKLEF